MSSVLVVVIVGVIIAAITAATVRDEPKPPTPAPPPPRDPDPLPVPWAPPEHRAEPQPVPSAPPVAPGPAHVRVEAPVDERTVLHRLRSAVLLVVAVVALGSLAAGLLGGMVYLGAHVINRALG